MIRLPYYSHHSMRTPPVTGVEQKMVRALIKSVRERMPVLSSLCVPQPWYDTYEYWLGPGRSRFISLFDIRIGERLYCKGILLVGDEDV